MIKDVYLYSIKPTKNRYVHNQSMPTQNTLIIYLAITDIVKPDDLPEFFIIFKNGSRLCEYQKVILTALCTRQFF